MYHYYFEGDTVRLAYWRIDYDNDKVMYANTDDCKDEIVALLTARGFTPTVSEIDQTGNEWIDGMCFTDHSKVVDALTLGKKNFICAGDTSDIANTLTAMNDAIFSVDESNVWCLTIPNIPSIPCYGIMTCVTTPSVDNQMISINGSDPVPFMKNYSDPVLAYDIMATPERPLAIQINVTNDKAFLNTGGAAGWAVGELKTFGYERAESESELLCNGDMYDRERYPELYKAIKDTYAVPAEYVVRSAPKLMDFVEHNGFLFARSETNIYRSTDGITWDSVYTAPTSSSSNRTLQWLRKGGNVLVASYSSTGLIYTHLIASTDNGQTWEDKLALGNNDSAGGRRLLCAYSDESNMWSIVEQNTDTDTYSFKYADETLSTIEDIAGSLKVSDYDPEYVCYTDNSWMYVLRNSSAFKVYTVNSPSPTSVPTLAYSTTVAYSQYTAMHYLNNMLFYFGGNKLYRFYSDKVISAAAPCKCGAVSYIPYSNSYIILGDECTAVFDPDTLSFKKTTTKTSMDISPIETCAWYDPLKDIIFSDGRNHNVYTLDAESFALPLSVENGYTYIKAE